MISSASRFASLAMCAALLASAAFAQQGGKAPPPGVLVQIAEMRNVSNRSTYIGRIEAQSSVKIRARVDGFLGPLLFKEGSEVRQGAPLYTIEKAPYEAAVSQAKAALASSVAAQALAQISYDRAFKLVQTRTASQSTLDEAKANRQEAIARVQGQKANLRLARLDLGYTDITAPISGKVGRSTYFEGALVGPGSNPLVTLVSQDPMLVAFPVSQARLLKVQRENKASNSMTVRLKLPDGSIYEHPGVILFSEVQSNSSTDTVTVRASMPNPDRLLIDRQIVGVFVEENTPEEKLVISQSSLLLDQQGAYVLIVNDKDQVQIKRVKPGAQHGPALVIEAGLKPGDRVLVGGMQKVRPGLKVTPQIIEGLGSLSPKG